MEKEQVDRHSSLTLSQPGAVVLRVDPDPPPEEALRERDAAQAETLRKATEMGTPFCEKCEPAMQENSSSDGA